MVFAQAMAGRCKSEPQTEAIQFRSDTNWLLSARLSGPGSCSLKVILSLSSVSQTPKNSSSASLQHCALENGTGRRQEGVRLCQLNISSVSASVQLNAVACAVVLLYHAALRAVQVSLEQSAHHVSSAVAENHSR